METSVTYLSRVPAQAVGSFSLASSRRICRTSASKAATRASEADLPGGPCGPGGPGMPTDPAGPSWPPAPGGPIGPRNESCIRNTPPTAPAMPQIAHAAASSDARRIHPPMSRPYRAATGRGPEFRFSPPPLWRGDPGERKGNGAPRARRLAAADTSRSGRSVAGHAIGGEFSGWRASQIRPREGAPQRAP